MIESWIQFQVAFIYKKMEPWVNLTRKLQNKPNWKTFESPFKEEVLSSLWKKEKQRIFQCIWNFFYFLKIRYSINISGSMHQFYLPPENGCLVFEIRVKY